jgi:hypothetical protein
VKPPIRLPVTADDPAARDWLPPLLPIPFLGGGAALGPAFGRANARGRRPVVVGGVARETEPPLVPAPLAALGVDDLDSASGDRTLTPVGPCARRIAADRGVSGVEEVCDVEEEEVVVVEGVGESSGPPAVPLPHVMLLRFDFFLRAAVIFKMGSFTSGLSIMTIPFNSLPLFPIVSSALYVSVPNCSFPPGLQPSNSGRSRMN